MSSGPCPLWGSSFANIGITRTKCMQNKNGLETCRIALQRIVLLKVNKTPGPNRSGISDLRFRGPKKGPTTAQI